MIHQNVNFSSDVMITSVHINWYTYSCLIPQKYSSKNVKFTDIRKFNVTSCQKMAIM